MPWQPHTIIENRLAESEAKFGLSSATVRAILGEFLESLHETTFKGSPTDALLGIYFTLGPESAWHFFGVIYDSLDDGPDSSAKDEWSETAERLDGRMKRFHSILDRWTDEKTYEIEQHRLDDEAENARNA